MPFEQSQQSLRQADNAAENRVKDISNDIKRLKENINELKAELKTKKVQEDIKKLKAELQQKKKQCQEIVYIWKAIRYILGSFKVVDTDAEQPVVRKAHKKVHINYVKPLYDSLDEVDFHPFLKKVGLTKNVENTDVYAKRIFHLLRRMTIKDREDHAQGRCGGISHHKFPIPDDAYEKQAFKKFNSAVVNWVSEVLGCQTFPDNLPTWTDPRFQVYLGYEALYIYLRSINANLAAEIDLFQFNFYDGLRCWLFRAHPRRDKLYAIAPYYFQWTKVLDKAQNNPITYLALFSKAVHLLLFVGNKNKAEETDALLSILYDEIEHLKPEDEEEVLEKVLEGMKAYENNASEAKPEKTGKSKKGKIRGQWCKSTLCRFLGLAYCEHIYGITQQIFPRNRILQKVVRDVLVKPLGSDSNVHNWILALLEGGRNAEAVNDIMTLVDKATFPVFREIWKILDAQPLEDDDDDA